MTKITQSQLTIIALTLVHKTVILTSYQEFNVYFVEAKLSWLQHTI